MVLFRVESGSIKEYASQEVITPTGKYSTYLNGISKQAPEYNKVIIEQALEKVQNCSCRITALFLFNELKDALIFSSKIYHGNARIYTVMVDPQSIICKGDMNVLDAITTAIQLELHKNDHDSFNGFCSHYWKNGKTFSPCYEYIVSKQLFMNSSVLQKNANNLIVSM